MTLLLIVVGAALLGAATFDVVATAVSLGGGAGPITRVLARSVWAAARRLSPRRHHALRRTGVAILLLSVVLWVLLVWAGWTLIFSAADEAVVDANTGQPATFEQRIYFAGYTILTLGNGDYRPDGPIWRIATVLAVANGFGLITLAITYLVPVVSAATQSRQLAGELHGLGSSPQDLLTGGWDGSSLSGVGRDLSGMSQPVLLHTQRHLSYPVLHYFHAAEPATAAPLRLAALDEGLTLLFHGVAPHARPSERRLTVLREALTGYLNTVTATYIKPADHPPELPDLSQLRRAEIPTVDDAEFARALESLADRRRRLLGLVRHDAWDWADLER